MWHGLRSRSLAISSVKCSGNQSGVITSSAAPDVEMLRTVQAIVVAPNPIVPAFNTRLRGAVRCSSMTGPSVKPDADSSLTPHRLDNTDFAGAMFGRDLKGRKQGS